MHTWRDDPLAAIYNPSQITCHYDHIITPHIFIYTVWRRDTKILIYLWEGGQWVYKYFFQCALKNISIISTCRCTVSIKDSIKDSTGSSNKIFCGYFPSNNIELVQPLKYLSDAYFIAKIPLRDNVALLSLILLEEICNTPMAIFSQLC